MTSRSALAEKLLPCPFCGGTPIVVDDNSYGDCIIECHCDVEPCVIKPLGELQAAAEIWNRRAAAAALRETGEPVAYLCVTKDGNSRHLLWAFEDAEEEAWLRARYQSWTPLYASHLSGLEQARLEQANRVMPLIGPLLDAFELANTDDLDPESSLRKHLMAVYNEMLATPREGKGEAK